VEAPPAVGAQIQAFVLKFFEARLAFQALLRGVSGLRIKPGPDGAVGTNMGELINLRNRRKQAVRREAAQKAEENRLAFGRSKAERIRDTLRAEKARRELDGSRLEPGDAE
jgi:hypothetical protein